jgi:hypothetical protein
VSLSVFLSGFSVILCSLFFYAFWGTITQPLFDRKVKDVDKSKAIPNALKVLADFYEAEARCICTRIYKKRRDNEVAVKKDQLGVCGFFVDWGGGADFLSAGFLQESAVGDGMGPYQRPRRFGP